ncbi:Phosphoribosylformimino-5-aminoimidazole carboxamide ribotide isomerase [Ceraceosorus guamensis]|uniref:1-(5-phosphoribosyl)-5-[(5-phosphoribosylamino)methylideneamino] imidazole-4-carboxamide isomerase n=1 Tax=Ceraceosorus guamensis TaxID=1522189 RepID=A0A316VPR5_9BASI|nr:Phosphoribosylformimino-5-aminoimidazole carboxamide ribotide isomerase [Ceraceosorus guamensis]PWN39512.1 Phosphoribosylformimino-5-aminoimidazole carboxamide ribotide isomerase [Ceraceosorus guamensis]
MSGQASLAATASSSTRPVEAGKRSLFRPCIDLHGGVVKQIVGGSLRDDQAADGQGRTAKQDAALRTNFTSTFSSAHYAKLYRQHDLRGGHVIMLGPGNADAAREALREWPGGLQVGGGINESNAKQWVADGAEKIIVTSYLFPDCKFSLSRLQALVDLVGKDRIVVDLSCRKRGSEWIVAMNRWQDLTDLRINQQSISMLSQHCSEFLIHAADVEGLCQGIDEQLVRSLGQWTDIPTTYAGGARHIQDLELVHESSGGKIDLTFGSALDIFGGKGVKLKELVEWNVRGSVQSE